MTSVTHYLIQFKNNFEIQSIQFSDIISLFPNIAYSFSFFIYSNSSLFISTKRYYYLGDYPSPGFVNAIFKTNFNFNSNQWDQYYIEPMAPINYVSYWAIYLKINKILLNYW